MSAADIWPSLRAPKGRFLCRRLDDDPDSGSASHAVPVEHRPLRGVLAEDPAALQSLPDVASISDLKVIIQETGGIALFAPSAWSLPEVNLSESSEAPTSREQMSLGSIVVWSSGEWARLREDFADWQFEGVDATFEGLPYGFEDILVFATINFSPDGWFVVLRGPMRGKVFWWTHDGDSQMDTPWAESIAAWGERVWREVPELFGGVIRFDGTACDPPEEAVGTLYPEGFVSE